MQMLYILNNLQGWRGPRARQVKGVLKAASEKPKGRPCLTCGKELGAESILGAVCGACTRKAHRGAVGEGG